MPKGKKSSGQGQGSSGSGSGGSKKSGGGGGGFGGGGGQMQMMMKMMQNMGGNPQAMMQQMMKMMQGQTGGGGGGGGGASSDMHWKEKLGNMLNKNSIAEKTTYEAADDGNGKFTGTATLMGQTYTTEKPADSKKKAEQLAAKAALKALYPEEFKSLAKGSTSGGGGQKRKAGSESAEPTSYKTKLVNSLQYLFIKNHGRQMTKGDTQWEVQEFEGSPKTYQASVTIPEHMGMTYTGEVCDSKKKAEESASQIAYDNMKDVLVPLEEEHKAKKKQKIAEENEAWKKKKEEEKAAKGTA